MEAEGLLDRLSGSGGPIALAVSGGPDSLALLLLAAAAWPGCVSALTVDHGLRPESASEAAMVARLCAVLGVPHRTLVLQGLGASKANVQARAREARYLALEAECVRQGIGVLMTAHHADDQAETLLMRLARGSGLSGLAGIRASRLAGGVAIHRPLLGWRKVELSALVGQAGLVPADDPSNRNPAYDRTAARDLLAQADWLDPARLTASVANLAQAEDALQWTADQAWRGRATRDGNTILLDLDGLPAELVRRLTVRAIGQLNPGWRPDGPSVDRLIAAVDKQRASTLGGIRVRYGRRWRFAVAPHRRAGN